jgi:hypothetical protein
VQREVSPRNCAKEPLMRRQDPQFGAISGIFITTHDGCSQGL